MRRKSKRWVRETIAAVVGGRIGYEDGLDSLTVAPAGEVDPVLTRAYDNADARKAEEAIGRFDANKARVDSAFYEDLKRVCAGYGGATKSACSGVTVSFTAPSHG